MSKYFTPILAQIVEDSGGDAAEAVTHMLSLATNLTGNAARFLAESSGQDQHLVANQTIDHMRELILKHITEGEKRRAN